MNQTQSGFRTSIAQEPAQEGPEEEKRKRSWTKKATKETNDYPYKSLLMSAYICSTILLDVVFGVFFIHNGNQPEVIMAFLMMGLTNVIIVFSLIDLDSAIKTLNSNFMFDKHYKSSYHFGVAMDDYETYIKESFLGNVKPGQLFRFFGSSSVFRKIGDPAKYVRVGGSFVSERLIEGNQNAIVQVVIPKGGRPT